MAGLGLSERQELLAASTVEKRSVPDLKKKKEKKKLQLDIAEGGYSLVAVHFARIGSAGMHFIFTFLCTCLCPGCKAAFFTSPQKRFTKLS